MEKKKGSKKSPDKKFVRNSLLSELMSYMTAKAMEDESVNPSAVTLKELYPTLAEFLKEESARFKV
jgi:hypothetical protein